MVRLQIFFRKTVTNAIYELSSHGVRTVLRLRRTGAADPSTGMVDPLNAAHPEDCARLRFRIASGVFPGVLERLWTNTFDVQGQYIPRPG
jgi:hypothetical protein